MTETKDRATEQVVTWVEDPDLGNLYVLHLDGRPAATTALVDRNAPRSAQMEALARLDWVPPQQMTQVYEATTQGRMPKPPDLVLSGGRRIGPLFSNLAAIIDGDEDPSPHPVRRYLYPDVTRDGELAVEPGEAELGRWRVRKPVLLTQAKDGTVKDASSSPLPSELRHVVGILTTKRLVCIGHLDVPLAAREDYSMKLALVSPGLDDLRATFRQVKRWHNRPNMFWGVHIRHEWASVVGHGHVPDHKGPLLKRSERTDFIAGGFTYPFGATGIMHLHPRDGEPLSSALAAHYLAAVQSDQPDAAVSAPSTTTRAVPALGLTSRKETEETTAWRLEGTHPYSLPPKF